MKYEVTIKAEVVKTITVEAESEAVAVERAHEQFTAAPDYTEERYEEDTVRVRMVIEEAT